MSALAIDVASTNWGANYVDRAVPYLSSAVGFYLFGGSQALSVINHAPGAVVNLTPNSAPVYGDGYVEMAYDAIAADRDYFSSGIFVAGSQTIIVVPTLSAGGEYYASSSGFLLGMNGATATQARYSSAFGPTVIGTANPGTSYGFIAGATAGTSGNPFNMYVGKADALTKSTDAVTNLGGALPSYEVKIGPSGQFSGGASHRTAAAMIFDIELTQAQILEIYQYLRFKLPKRGITIA